MKTLYIIIALLLISINITAQVAGTSASKLNAVCVDVVDDKKVEFEPGFYHSTTNKFWDNDSKLQNQFSSDSTNHISSMYMRVTYGLFNKMELGLVVPLDMSAIDFGMRYIISQREKIGFAVIAGVNAPLGNAIVQKDKHTILNTAQIGLGGVVTYDFNKDFSIDFNTGYGKYFNQDNIDYLTYLSADAGYYFFNHQFQVVTGLGYKYFKHNETVDNQFLLTFYPGITIETGERYILVLTSPVDIYGENIIKTFNLGFALTIIID